MKNVTTTILCLASFALPFTMAAHDKKLHKGKATEGEIVSVSKNGFQVKTATGTVPVTFTEKTKFEHGKDVVDSSHVKAGDHVSVFGTKLASGELVGKEILLGSDDAHAHGTSAKMPIHHANDKNPASRP